MKKHYFSLYLVILLLVACGDTQVAGGDGGMSGTGDGFTKVDVIEGMAYKGPLIMGSSIDFYRIQAGQLSEQAVSTTVRANTGKYSLELQDGTYSIRAQGQYYRETSGDYSDNPITLNGIAQFGDLFYANVHPLTHITYPAMLQAYEDEATFFEILLDIETQTVNTLSSIAGAQQLPPFSAMRIDGNSDTTLSVDANEYALYIAALLDQASTLQSGNPLDNLNALFTTLQQLVINKDALDEETLSLLQEAHGLLNPDEIQENLQTIYPGRLIPGLGTIIGTISDKLRAPEKLNTHNGNQNFKVCLEQWIDCSVAISFFDLNGFSYDIQIDDNEDFSSPEYQQISRRAVTNIEASTLLLNQGFIRVRKRHDSGHYSQWIESSFLRE